MCLCYIAVVVAVRFAGCCGDGTFLVAVVRLVLPWLVLCIGLGLLFYECGIGLRLVCGLHGL